MIQYATIVLIGFVILVLRYSAGSAIFLNIFLKILPVIVVLLVKKIIYFFTTRIFLKKNTKILALDNFRAFNVFLYFNFFFDFFIGIISALIRLVQAVIFSILMMPRIAYSFFGRYLEKMDSGYSSYMGYLYMEACK